MGELSRVSRKQAVRVFRLRRVSGALFAINGRVMRETK